MALSLKKAYKIREFIAHSSNVNCAALGHKSGQVLVTGGDDKKVNLWAIGKPNCIMSLSGHTTSIHCVRFGHSENQVCAGSFAGAVKLWDLEAAKLLRTLTGHKGSVRALEFHPFGDFITSGSADSCVKLWDVRKKGCVASYKGHSQPVNSLKFSPDGLWIASAGQDGLLKLWDLRIGRMLREFTEHSGAVNAVEFHPHEFLIASAGQDNTLHFWDLERFSLVSSTQPELPSSRCLEFSSGGECLYGGGQDVLRVYGWEPGRTLASLHVPWGRPQDIAFTQDKIIGATVNMSTVSVWMVELGGGGGGTDGVGSCTPPVAQQSRGANTATSAASSPLSSSTPFSHGNSLRKSFNRQKPTPEAKKSLSVKTIEESERSETDPEDESQPEIPDVNDYRAIFRPSRALNRSPPISLYTPRSGPPPSSVLSQEDWQQQPLERSSPPERRRPSSPPSTEESYSTPPQGPPPAASSRHHLLSTSDEDMRVEEIEESEGRLSPISVQQQPMPIPVVRHQQQLSTGGGRRHSLVGSNSSSQRSTTGATGLSTTGLSTTGLSATDEFPVKLSSLQGSVSESSIPQRAAAAAAASRTRQPSTRGISHLSTPSKPALRETKSDRGPGGGGVKPGGGGSYPSQLPPPPPPPHRPVSPPPPPLDYIPMSADRPSGLQLDDFLPKSLQGRTGGGVHQEQHYGSNTFPDISEQEALSSVLRGHDSIMAILAARQRNLQIVYTHWQSKDLKSAVETAVNMSDHSVLVDFLGIITQKPSLWNLDICVVVLPAIYELLQSRYETHMRAGCNALQLILRSFTSVIKTNVLSGSSTFGVDIPREERYRKCMSCYQSLVSIRAFLLKRQTLQGSLGQSFRELHSSLAQIDTS